jgi:hypothetical protein
MAVGIFERKGEYMGQHRKTHTGGSGIVIKSMVHTRTQMLQPIQKNRVDETICRMGEARTPRKILQDKMHGSRTAGKPKDVRKLPGTAEGKRLPLNRKIWRIKT